MKGKDYLSRRDLLQIGGKPLVRKYVDKRGVARHVGISDSLKASQCLGDVVCCKRQLRAYTAAFGARVAGSFTECREVGRSGVKFGLGAGCAAGAQGGMLR